MCLLEGRDAMRAGGLMAGLDAARAGADAAPVRTMREGPPELPRPRPCAPAVAAVTSKTNSIAKTQWVSRVIGKLRVRDHIPRIRKL